MPRDQNAGRDHNINTSNRFFGRAEEFKQFGKTLKNPNFSR